MPSSDAAQLQREILGNPRCIEIMTLLAPARMYSWHEGDLAYTLKCERSQIAEYVALLMQAGLVDKASDSNTGVICYLTPAGHALLRENGIVPTSP